MRTRHIVRVCCSDGAQSKPEQIRGSFVHEIREPGGILFPNLYARHSGHSDPNVVAELLRVGTDMLLFKIDTMVKFKSPDEIVLMAHDPCAAAGVLDMTTEEVEVAYLEWEEKLRQRYPDTSVYTLLEPHSPCGNHRKPHVRVTKQKVAA
jgi:hypothetical protein